jgi:ATP-dependent Lhr-like helicase
MSDLSRAVGKAFYGSFRELRPTQREATTPILDGLDVLVLSPTGSGKTEAVLAPLVDRYLPAMRSGTGCTVLYITPTRALANDLLRRLQPSLDRLGVSVGIRHGERNDLSRASKPGVLITTPESLDVMLVSREQWIVAVRAIVIDEIHLTYNTQRGFQLALLIRRLEHAASRQVQVIGLSATVADAKSMWDFFRPGSEHVVVRDQGSKPLDYYIAEVPRHEDVATLINLLATEREAKILLFANSRRECDSLGAALRSNTTLGEDVFVHHSSLDREARLEVERAFQQSRRAICVATSTLELGIDIGDIDLVMLYGRPGSWESLLQRIGRGNRRSEKTNVVCVVSPEHGSLFLGALGFEALFSQLRNGRFEREQPLDLYGAAAQQILSVLAERNGAYHRVADLAALFSPWLHLTRPAVERILSALTLTDHVRAHGFENRFGAGGELHRLRDLSLIWSNFSARSRDIKLMSSGREIGVVPANNLLRLRPGVVVRFAGRHWQVRRVQSSVVDLEPSRQSSAVEISYSGSKAPLDPMSIEEMLRLLDSEISVSRMAVGRQERFLEVADRVRRYVGWDRIPVAIDERGYHYFTFAGQLVNSVVARWAELTSFDAGEIVLRSQHPIEFSKLPTNPHDLRFIASQAMLVPENLSIFQQLLPTELLERELIDVWLKTPVFVRSLERLSKGTVVHAPLSQLAELYV